MAHDVFISYSSKDKLTADAICHALEQNGIKCWIAPGSVRPGFDYPSEIMFGIENSKLMVLLFSEESNNSSFVYAEVERAFAEGKMIIPYRLSQIEMNRNLKFLLSGKHWIDAYPDDTVFADLIAAVKNAMGIAVVSAPAPAPKSPETPVVKEVKPTAAPDPITMKSQNYTIGSAIHFGDYDWRVLDVEDGKALIITKDIVFKKPYSVDDNYLWEKSSLRTYLNIDFLNDFTKDENEIIVPSVVKAPIDFYYKKPVGNETEDKIFLLSVEEVEKYFFDQFDRTASFNGSKDDAQWWLRTPCRANVALVNGNVYGTAPDGSNGTGKFSSTHQGNNIGVRPAMWIELGEFDSTSQRFTEKETKQTVIPSVASRGKYYGSDLKVGDVIEFGRCEWIVWSRLTGSETTPSYQGAVLISKDILFNENFDANGKPYENSFLKNYLNIDFLSDTWFQGQIFSGEEKERLLKAWSDTNDPSQKSFISIPNYIVTSSGAQFIEDFEYNQKNSSEFIATLFTIPSPWWVKDYQSGKAILVNGDGQLDFDPPMDNVFGVRPLIQIKLDEADSTAHKESNSAAAPTPTITNNHSYAVGSVIPFGNYDWRVLDVQNGRALIITEQIIDGNRSYNEALSPRITWEECSLRKWLNNEFLMDFYEDEQEKIISTLLNNRSNPKCGTRGGNNTEDKVFLLSIDEAEQYFKSDDDRRAELNNVWAKWCLRSPSSSSAHASFVNISGSINVEGKTESPMGLIINDVKQIRPAMWIKLDGENSVAKQNAEITQNNDMNHTIFSQMLSQVKKNDECVVYFHADTRVVVNSYSAYLFYPTGIVVRTGGMGHNKREQIEELIKRTNSSAGGYPDLEKPQGYPAGRYMLNANTINFTIECNNGDMKEDYSCILKDNGDIDYTVSSDCYANGTMKLCGVFSKGFFNLDENFKFPFR